MNANAIPFLNIFEKKLRLEVPLFQRQYVWSLEQQWEPLWEDVQAVAERYLKGNNFQPRFMGAVVLEQMSTPTEMLDVRQIIEGQQRLIQTKSQSPRGQPAPGSGHTRPALAPSPCRC